MPAFIPCIRQGSAEIRDSQLVQFVNKLEAARPGASQSLKSMYLLDGREIWITWSTPRDRGEYSGALTDICTRQGFNVRHLVPLDVHYDYQEDVPLLA